MYKGTLCVGFVGPESPVSPRDGGYSWAVSPTGILHVSDILDINIPHRSYVPGIRNVTHYEDQAARDRQYGED